MYPIETTSIDSGISQMKRVETTVFEFQFHSPQIIIEMKKTNLFLLTAFFSCIVFTSCKKDEDSPETPPPVVNDGEIITTVTLKFTDVAGILPAIEYTFRDPDGEGGNPATTFDQILLQSETTYNCEILLLNETVNPADTISNEVLEEADEHLFCYVVNGAPITIVRTDSDGTYEVGLETLWSTEAVATGTVEVTLKHQPGGIKNGSCDPGDTDIELVFDLIVE
jgi:hypothetical protein